MTTQHGEEKEQKHLETEPTNTKHPWQSSQKHLTPGRVAQSLFSLLIEIGTPASLPKTRGKSPGWKTGRKRSQKKTYPIAKKSYSRPKKSKKGAA